MVIRFRLLPFALACVAAGVCFALVLRMRGGAPEPAERSAFAPTSTREQWAELAGNTALPPALAGPKRYLDERWGHMEERALALPAVEKDGEPYFILPEPVRGENAAGEPVYAIGFAKARRFGGPVFRTAAESGAQGGALMRAPGAAQPESERK
ncbi:MAG: hypothetical protein EPO68_12250 [Planctomycetota bacterium]|nr:MAG: hypothetical protein EPO68_12250 [Planctomycetota bacterium]